MEFNKQEAFNKLLNTLAKDPSLKNAIEQFKQGNATSNLQVNTANEALLQIAKLVGTFVNKKKANMISDYVEIATLLISLSIFLKVNVFDRPEVKQFLEESFESVKIFSSKAYIYCQKYIESMIGKIKSKESAQNKKAA